MKRVDRTEKEFDVLCIAIAKLPPQRRKILMLLVFYEYSTRQFAESLNMPIRRVRHDLARALEAVHTARAMFEVDRGSLFTNLMARQRHGTRDT